MQSKSNHDLVNFFTECEEETLASTFELMNSIFSFESKRFKKFTDARTIYALSTEERKEIANKAVARLRYFGSDSIAYAGRKILRKEPGVNYQTMVREVAKILNDDSREPYAIPLGIGQLLKKFNVTRGKSVIIPRVASVSDYENLIVELLLKKLIEGKSTDELVEIFTDCDLDREQAIKAAKRISSIGTAGSMFILLVKILGKKTVKELVMVVLAQILEKHLGKEAAKIIIEKIASKTTQKLLAKIVSGVGWALIAFDVIKLGGPATRITVPTVAFLASVRTVAALEQGA